AQERARTAEAEAQGVREKAALAAEARDQIETQLYFQRIASAERELAAQNLGQATRLLAACPPQQRGWGWHCLQRPGHAAPVVLHGHAAAIAAVAFHPQGRLLTSAGWDRTVRIWDVSSNQEIRSLPGHTRWVSTVAFSPDGRRLASAGFDHTVKI